MQSLWEAVKTYQGFVAKSGIVEMLRREVRSITLKGSGAITLRIIMQAVRKAERKVQKIQKTEKERAK